MLCNKLVGFFIVAILNATVAFALPSALKISRFASYGYIWQKPTCSSCCHLLHFALPNKVFFANEVAYNQTVQSYWSAQEQFVIPGCVVRPTCTQDVQVAINVLTASGGSDSGCKFAIKGAGHTPWAGSANIQNGVTIDLALMNSINLSKDQKITFVGPGARWKDVYGKLDPMGLTVVGGRVGNVGVAGLTTGGGLSFFSSQYGFTCDNVVNFEVVLASGKCVIANARTNKDLFWALKGGSNNFGIVTRFDMKTFPLPSGGKMWGGLVALPLDTTKENVAALVKFNNGSTDPRAAIINTYGYISSIGFDYIVNSYEYTDSTPTFKPAAFSEFQGITPQLFSTVRLTNLSDITAELDSRAANGFKQIFITSTYANNASLLEKVVEFSTAAYQPLKRVANLTWSVSFQPLSTAITSKSASTGGNALGLSEKDGNLIVSLLGVTWSNSSDDAAINAAVKKFMDEADGYAKSVGGLHRYRYLNYADKSQDPITGYGAQNVAKLQKISKYYDPRSVFQKQVPGGFKLFK